MAQLKRRMPAAQESGAEPLEVGRDLLHECRRIAEHDSTGGDIEFPTHYVGSSEHVKFLWAREQAWQSWRRELLERYRDQNPLVDLLVGGPRFPKGGQSCANDVSRF